MTSFSSVSPGAPKLEGFETYSAVLRSDSHDLAQIAHATTPVFFDPEQNAWVFTKYDDIYAALRDSETYSSRLTRGLVEPPAELLPLLPDYYEDRSILAMDPPEHTAFRMPMQRAISRRLVDAIEPVAEEVANSLIDGLIERGQCDLIHDFCFPFSAAVILKLLGIPAERDFRKWLEHRAKLVLSRPPGTEGFKSDNGMSPEEIYEHWSQVAEANQFFRAYVLDHIENPKDDVISAMLSARDDNGNPAFEVGDVVYSIFTLVAGGHDTTANLIANTVILLSENPTERTKLLNDMSLLGNAIEEALRRLGPAWVVVRTLTKDINLRGQEIRKGSLIYLWLHAGNLDAEMFPDPGRFDITRDNAAKHLDFGSGRHACVGQPLARLETEVALRILFERLPRLHATAKRPFKFKRKLIALQLESCPVSW